MMERLLKGIDLTSAQKDQVDALMKSQGEAQKAAMEAMRASGQRPDEATMKKMMETREQNQKAIRDVLTPEQQAIFDKNVEEMKQARSKMAPPPQG
jgi:Spy/CpxP family protein refolding chaperone